MKPIFVSYAHEDKKRVRSLVEGLEEFRDFWSDWDDVPPGYNWRREINRGIRQSSCVLFFVSQASIESEWCLEELRVAIWWRKPVLPVVIQTGLKLPRSLYNSQWVILSDDNDQNIKEILSGLAACERSFPWKAIALVEAIALVVGAILYGIAASG
ncbi:toll/interleukin-1 receptor domain-containing protein [Coleofasciculus sp. E2-BRE-01]|uniref:toll/interleukin-1 receptor domain-containing protein n=1 Tax=Coleofasciculus sp. E2-BRE-01 TaxID=3069524 RepID=UPI0032F2250D